MAERQELQVVLKTTAEGRGAEQTATALRRVRQEARSTSFSVRDMAAAFGIATTAAGLAQQAIQMVIAAVGSTVNAQRENERVTRAVAAAYGQGAQEVERFASALAEQTSFTRQAVLEAALYGRTLSANFGLATDQVQNLIRWSADLAAVQGLELPDAFKRVSDAIRGEAEASEFLGLTLGNTYMQNVAFNGALKNTWEQMTEAEKAQLRYLEALKQTGRFTNFAGGETNNMDFAIRRTESSINKLQIAVAKLAAPAVMVGLQGMANAMEALATHADAAWRSVISLSAATRGLDKFFKDLDRYKTEIDVLLGRGRSRSGGGGTGGFDDKGPTTLLPAAKTEAEILDEILRDVQARVDAEKAARDATRETAKEAEKILTPFERLVEELNTIDQQIGELGRLKDIIAPGDLAAGATLAAEEDLLRIERISRAREAAAERLKELRSRVTQTTILDPRDAPGVIAAREQVAIYDQLEAAERDLLIAEQERTNLQRQNVDLAAEEARLRLEMLPAQARMAELQRTITEQQARARLASLPATEALEDLRYEQERARLIASNRLGTSPEERSAARRTIRGLAKAEPGVALAALEAQRSLVPGERAATRLGIQEQLMNVANERALAGIQLDQQRNGFLQTIATAMVDLQKSIAEDIVNRAANPIALSVNIDNGGGLTLVYQELIEATSQAAMPPVLQQSGVRR